MASGWQISNSREQIHRFVVSHSLHISSLLLLPTGSGLFWYLAHTTSSCTSSAREYIPQQPAYHLHPMAILLKSLTSGRKRQSWVMLIFLAVVPGCQLPDKFLIRELFLASETEALLPTSRTLRFPFSSAPLSFSLSSLSSL